MFLLVSVRVCVSVFVCFCVCVRVSVSVFFLKMRVRVLKVFFVLVSCCVSLCLFLCGFFGFLFFCVLPKKKRSFFVSPQFCIFAGLFCRKVLRLGS